MNVTIIVVALGDWYDIGQIESAASYPHSNTILLTTSVQVVQISWKVHEMICEGKKAFLVVYGEKVSKDVSS